VRPSGEVGDQRELSSVLAFITPLKIHLLLVNGKGKV